MINGSDFDSSCVEQKSSDWFRARLGHITSSKVSMVMLESSEVKEFRKAQKALTDENPKLKKGQTIEDYRADIRAALPGLQKAADENPFSDTAKGYLFQVAAERNLKPSWINDEEKFAQYLDRVQISSKAIRLGEELENTARLAYRIKSGYEVAECGFIKHNSIANFGDSPDGIVVDKEGKPIGALEIKCPKPDTWIRYKVNIVDAESLKEEKPEYYWQCQSHCENNNLPWCDFAFFDEMQRDSLQIVRIPRNDEDIQMMLLRVQQANDYIDNVILK